MKGPAQHTNIGSFKALTPDDDQDDDEEIKSLQYKVILLGDGK